LLLGIFVAAFSAHTSFFSAPWGNRQFEILITKLGNTKAAATLREGTFSEGFFDLVVYSQHVDAKTNRLKNVFIYDERDHNNPITIIAKEGQIVPNSNPGQIGALLRLSDGNIHRTSNDSYTKINFSSYDLNLTRPINEVYAEKSMLSMTLDELNQGIHREKDPVKKRALLSEFHKRWAISVACILFALLGVGLGTVTHKRNVRSGSLVMSLGVIITYWALYVVGDNLARSGALPPAISIWFANIFFFGLAIALFRRALN
jgi:lipopolysaccharide export system permease protein